MFSLTVRLRRLLLPRPSAQALQFFWWLVAEGGDAACRGFIRQRGFDLQDVVDGALMSLEIWDTKRFRAWRAAGSPTTPAPGPVLPASALGHVAAVGDYDTLHVGEAAPHPALEPLDHPHYDPDHWASDAHPGDVRPQRLPFDISHF